MTHRRVWVKLLGPAVLAVWSSVAAADGPAAPAGGDPRPFREARSFSPEEILARGSAAVRTFEDPVLSFKMAIPTSWVRLDVPADLYQADERQTLGLYRTPAGSAPEAEIEVETLLLEREVAPADWLRLQVERSGWRVLREGELRVSEGACPDWLVEAAGPSGAYVFRLSARKNGRRLFLLSARTTVTGYASVADDFGIAIGTWMQLHPGERRYAERLLEVDVNDPIRARIRHLATWTPYTPEGVGPGAGGIGFRWSNGKETGGSIAVKLYAKAGHESERLEDYVRMFSQDMKTLGIALGPQARAEPALFPRFPRAGVLLVSLGQRGDREVEVAGLILQSNEAWVVLEGISPTRAANPEAWMVNKRALEVMAMQLNPRRE